MFTRTILTIISGILWIHTSAQSYQKEVISIIPPKVFSLDSRGSGLFNREHSLVLEVILPENTIEWYYRFTCVNSLTEADEIIKYTDLFGNVKQAIEDSTYLLKKDTLIASSGSVSLYILSDSTSISDFISIFPMSKNSFAGQISCIDKTSGQIPVKDEEYLHNKQYIGLINEATIQEAHVILEVVAVIKQALPAKNGWTTSELENWYAEIVGICANMPDSIISTASIPTVAACFISALETKWNADVFQSMNETDQLQWKNWQIQRCLTDKMAPPKKAAPSLDDYLLTGHWQTEKGERIIISFNKQLKLFKKDGRELTGQWKLENGVFSMLFKNYKTQYYTATEFSENKIEWRNKTSGNYLRLQRINH